MRLVAVGVILSMATLYAKAQEDVAPADSIAPVVTSDTIARDSSLLIPPSSLDKSSSLGEAPSSSLKRWTPKPQRALWLALVIPGGGQIYNRKYWKLPIFYGGMMGCIYAMTWNNMMYKDYSQAYLDIMDSDPTTESYNKFLHLGTQITSTNEERFKKIFKSRKDKYRRWRDLSIFCLIGVYALSVIDAYVDAELSEFDISNDLSLRIEPAVINNGSSLDNSSIGLQCSINF